MRCLVANFIVKIAENRFGDEFKHKICTPIMLGQYWSLKTLSLPDISYRIFSNNFPPMAKLKQRSDVKTPRLVDKKYKFDGLPRVRCTKRLYEILYGLLGEAYVLNVVIRGAAVCG